MERLGLASQRALEGVDHEKPCESGCKESIWSFDSKSPWECFDAAIRGLVSKQITVPRFQLLESYNFKIQNKLPWLIPITLSTQ